MDVFEIEEMEDCVCDYCQDDEVEGILSDDVVEIGKLMGFLFILDQMGEQSLDYNDNG